MVAEHEYDDPWRYDREELERFDRFIRGHCTAEEARAVERRLAEDPELAELIRRARRARAIAQGAEELWDLEAAWQKFRARREGPHTPARTVPAPDADVPSAIVSLERARKRRARWGGVLRVAASVAVLLGGTLLWQNRDTLFSPEPPPLQELVTGIGERTRITLADGSEIVLGPASVLQFREPLGAEREVRLEGEAVFDVSPDSARRFRVLTDLATTEVLGTRFGVKAYPDNDYMEVVVAEGRVAVSPADTVTHLTQDQAARIGSDGTLAGTRTVNAERLLSWTEGHLIFERTPLNEVARTLQRRYGVRIEVEDSAVASLQLTAEFLQPGKVAEVVRLISYSLGIGYSETNTGFLLFHASPTVDGAR